MTGPLSGRCINIHHSFLPGFKGAKPYHQGAVPLDAIRSTLKDSDPLVRSLWFTPAASGEIVLAVDASGLTDDVGLDLVGSSAGIVSKGRVRTSVQAGQRVQLDVTLSEPFAGPIELSAVRFIETPAEKVA